MRRRWSRLWPWLLAALFLFSLVPLISLGRFARAAADDYGYGIFTHQAVQAGHGFLKAVWRTATGYYDSWQGTFSALALMSLTPCIWSEQAYWLTPVVFLALIPLLWKLTGIRGCRFPLPVLFSVFTFLLFAAQNAPTSTPNPSPGRSGCATSSTSPTTGLS